MELLQLQYFKEVARSEHLSKTAEKLNITQPSLSKTLKRLENELGVTLFQRSGRGLQLNPYGEVLLKYTDEIFNSLNNAKLELNEMQKFENQIVELNMRSASMLLPELVKSIQNCKGDIKLRISQSTVNKISQVPTLNIYSTFDKPIENEYRKILLKESIKIAIPKYHQLIERDNITWADIENEPFLSLTGDCNLTKIVQHFCELKNIKLDISTQVESPSILRDLLNLDLGFAFVPEYTWVNFSNENIILKSLYDLPMERYIILEWDRDWYQTTAFKLCKNNIIDFFNRYNQQCQ